MERSFGLDVHLEFIEIAVCEQRRVRQLGRIATTPEAIREFAAGLGSEDQVVLEASCGAMRIARLLGESAVGRVVVCNAAETRAISHARVKSDRFDAAMLARLLAAGMLGEVWVPDEATSALRRRVARRAGLVRARTRVKNEVHAVLARCLLGRPPVSDLFGKKGRDWLAGQELPEEEAQTVASCLRHIDFLDGEVGELDRRIAEQALALPGFHRLLTIPGVDVGVAAAVIGAIGEITRFKSPGQLVAYLGLDPKVRQSGSEPARYGHISKRGDPQARTMLVEAAWRAIRTPGPLRAFGERVRARRGAQIAAVAVARKLAVLCWHLLAREEDYAFQRPSLTRQKTRRLELIAGAPPLARRHDGPPVSPTISQREAEKALQLQAELAYRRTIADWRTAAPRGGAGATPGRASQKPSKAKPRGRPQAPDACTSLRQSPAPAAQSPTTSRLPPPAHGGPNARPPTLSADPCQAPATQQNRPSRPDARPSGLCDCCAAETVLLTFHPQMHEGAIGV